MKHIIDDGNLRQEAKVDDIIWLSQSVAIELSRKQFTTVL